MKSARTNRPGLRLTLALAIAGVFFLAGAAVAAAAPARAEPGDDGGMPIVVVVSDGAEPSASPTPGGGAGGGGGLPKTGLDIVLIAGVGAGLVALGAAVLVLARRRPARA